MREALGRDWEVAAVRAALRARHSVAIVGVAGIGKTTILRASLDGVPARFGATVPSLRRHTYLPLKMALGQDLGGTTEEVARRVARALAGDALVLEDVHWADEATCAVVGALSGVVPVTVTSRPPLARWAEGLPWDLVQQVEPLRSRDAATLVRRLHPDLDAPDRDALLAAAGGNALLLETLIGPQGLSDTLEQAVIARLDQLAGPERAVLERLSVLGRPALPAVVGLIDPEALTDLVVHAGGEIAIRLALLRDAILSSLGSGRSAVHRYLAARLPDAEAAHHHLAGEEAALARERALRAAARATGARERAELLNIVVHAEEALGRPDARTRVDASAALVAAGRWSEAAELGARVVEGGDPAMEAEASLHQARGLWFSGQVEEARAAFELGSERVTAERAELGIRLVVERAYLEVRDRTPGALSLARSAHELAEAHGCHEARARTVLGAALLYEQQDGWEAELERSSQDAEGAGDHELACEAMFHLTSGLGFQGRVREAVDMARRGIRLADAHGMSTWSTHFLAATIMNETMMCGDREWVVERAASLLAQYPTFRNRAYTMFASMLALADLGRRPEVDAVVERLSAPAPEGQVFRFCAVTELAWLDRDPDGLASMDEGREVGEAYFGLRILAEVSAQHLAVELDVTLPVSLPATTLPLLRPALQEIEGLQRWRTGDTEGAIATLDRAGSRWMEIPIPRYAVRAAFAASLLARRSRRPDADGRRRRALAAAQRHGLAAHIVRVAGVPSDRLTGRERAILDLVAAGRTSSEIAAVLGIRLPTVEQHVGAARRKLGASTRREAASIMHAGDGW